MDKIAAINQIGMLAQQAKLPLFYVYSLTNDDLPDLRRARADSLMETVRRFRALGVEVKATETSDIDFTSDVVVDACDNQ